MSLVEFLLARIDEDEAAARRFMVDNDDYPDHVLGQHPCGWIRRRTVDSPGRHLDVEDFEGGPGNAARVLADCEARRRLVHHAADTMDAGGRTVLELLALPYADHPGYREEWLGGPPPPVGTGAGGSEGFPPDPEPSGRLLTLG